MTWLLDQMPYPWMKLAVAFAMMLAVVPLVGLCVTGSWKQGWRYARDWGRSMLIMLAGAGVIWLMVWPFMPTP